MFHGQAVGMLNDGKRMPTLAVSVVEALPRTYSGHLRPDVDCGPVTFVASSGQVRIQDSDADMDTNYPIEEPFKPLKTTPTGRTAVSAPTAFPAPSTCCQLDKVSPKRPSSPEEDVLSKRKRAGAQDSCFHEVQAAAPWDQDDAMLVD